MPSQFRVPKADLSTPYGRAVAAVSRRMLGQVPDNLYVLWHHRPALWAMLGLERRVARFDRLEANLKSYAQLAAAAQIGCTWCVDFGYYLAHNDGLDLATLREVPRWRTSSAFTDVERAVLDYTEAMTSTPPTVTDEMVDGLVGALGVPAVVELTEMVAIENQRARFNAAMGLAAQGFAASCDLPPLILHAADA